MKLCAVQWQVLREAGQCQDVSAAQARMKGGLQVHCKLDSIFADARPRLLSMQQMMQSQIHRSQHTGSVDTQVTVMPLHNMLPCSTDVLA